MMETWPLHLPPLIPHQKRMRFGSVWGILFLILLDTFLIELQFNVNCGNALDVLILLS